MPSHYTDEFNKHLKNWRNGGHRGPLTASQKKAKLKTRKKKKNKK